MDEWANLVQQHGPAVYRSAWRLLGNEADAADCYQDAFVSAVKISRRTTVRSWPALLHRLVTVRALDRLRQRARASRRREDGDPGQVPSRRAGPLEQLQADELAGRLRTVLATLPPKWAQAFCLRTFDELSYEQIAEAMDVPAAQVGVLLHRCRARLRELLDASEVHHD